MAPNATDQASPETLMGYLLQDQYLGPHATILRPEQGESVAWLPASIGRAARVEEQEVILVLQKGYVRVAEDDRACLGEAFFETLPAALFAPGVVDHGYPRAADAKLTYLGEIHLRQVYVTSDGEDRSVSG